MPHALDKQNMEWVIKNSPYQFKAGLQAADQVSEKFPKGQFDCVLVAGMGGSAMPAALVEEAGLNAVRIVTHKSYGLPEGFQPERTLVIASSYSGNTEETLEAYDEAKAKGFPLVGISKGGKLKEKCEADGVPFVGIPVNTPSDVEPQPQLQPRYATGYGVGILVSLLDHLGLAVSDARTKIEQLEESLLPLVEPARRWTTDLVPKLKTDTPVIYAPHGYENVARICKIKFNENAKCPAFWNVLPELNHNEMTGWLHNPAPRHKFHLIFLSDPETHERILLRQEVTRKILQQRAGLESTVIPLEGRTKLEKMFYGLLVGDWLSYELALALGENPSPVELVEEFKQMLKT